jgi:hypothetical protein
VNENKTTMAKKKIIRRKGKKMVIVTSYDPMLGQRILITTVEIEWPVEVDLYPVPQNSYFKKGNHTNAQYNGMQHK